VNARSNALRFCFGSGTLDGDVELESIAPRVDAIACDYVTPAKLELLKLTHTTHKRRKPYPRVRHPRKTVFTPAMWRQWMIEKSWLTAPPDETRAHLRAGIAEFRHRLDIDTA
jgi:hypothetical protein